MALILVAGLILGLGLPAWRVYQERDYHVHTAVDVRGPMPSITIMGGMVSPFWPRYWRRLLGRPYRSEPLCGPTPGFEAEVCEHAEPSMAIRIGGQVAYTANLKQAEWIKAHTTP